MELNEQIKGIYDNENKAIEEAMKNHEILAGDILENIKMADKEAREYVYKNFGGK